MFVAGFRSEALALSPSLKRPKQISEISLKSELKYVSCVALGLIVKIGNIIRNLTQNEYTPLYHNYYQISFTFSVGIMRDQLQIIEPRTVV